MRPELDWSDFQWMREQWNGLLYIKGVLDADDAVRAVDLGADGIVVSNHGGRQLDGAVASATALPGVCEAVHGRCEVLLDSGIRGGTDVLRALSLGASGVLLGRPALWGLASGGAPGAARVLSLLAEEVTETMHLAGCPDVASARGLHAP
jgi:4-hydroxymandelate oxidase